jgi:hypothetical protein
VDRQFGVIWPEAFAKALDALHLLSLDFGILLSVSCIVQTSFIEDLLFSTLAFFAVVVSVVLGYKLGGHGATGTFIAVYIFVFAYPSISAKVAEVSQAAHTLA